MLTVEALKDYGADVKEGLMRCMNNEAFYIRLVGMAAEDGGFARLQTAVESGETNEIFEAAHALKGMLGNLALTPLFEPASEITELSRAGKEADYAALWSELAARRKELQKLRDEA